MKRIIAVFLTFLMLSSASTAFADNKHLINVDNFLNDMNYMFGKMEDYYFDNADFDMGKNTSSSYPISYSIVDTSKTSDEPAYLGSIEFRSSEYADSDKNGSKDNIDYIKYCYYTKEPDETDEVMAGMVSSVIIYAMSEVFDNSNKMNNELDEFERAFSEVFDIDPNSVSEGGFSGETFEVGDNKYCFSVHNLKDRDIMVYALEGGNKDIMFGTFLAGQKIADIAGKM